MQTRIPHPTSRVMLVLLVGGLAAACARQQESAVESTPAAPITPDSEPALAAPSVAPDTAGRILTVNGKTLTEAQVAREVNLRMATLPVKPSGEQQAEQERKRLRAATINQFVIRALLEGEADRQNIAVSPEEEAKAFERLRESLPPDRSLDAMLASSPEGEARMQADIRTGIRVNKLIEKEVASRIEVTDEAVAEFLARNPEARNQPERVRARHILIPASAAMDAEARTAARAKAEDLRKQIVDQGASFEALAEEFSACPSRQRGGDLGVFPRGRMAKPFEEAVFDLEPGVIAPVVETQFGYHVVEMLEKKEAGAMDAKEVREMLKRQKRDRAMHEFLDSLRNKATIVHHQPMP